MSSSLPTPHPVLPQLQVHGGADHIAPVLAWFQAGYDASSELAQAIGLQALGEASHEQWLGTGPMRFGGRDATRYAMDAQLMRISIECEDHEADPVEVVRRSYRDLLASVRSAGYPHLLRIWNFLPAINEGAGDAERYRRFCVGRAEAMAEYGLAGDQMCAATAIGCHDRRFRLFALASKQPGQSIENPRQVSAWHYPAEYGPVSPAFARATALPVHSADHGQQWALLVSGTASVVGHQTQHAGDVAAQTTEALNNLDELLQAAASQLQAPALSALNTHSRLRWYVRHASDWPAVEAVFKARWPTVPAMALHGDICRRDLLVELEAWHSASI